MIIGIGNDLIDITRIERTLERFGERFAMRCFTELERSKSDRRLLRAASYAKRYAAKEACSKALGTGFRKGVFWRDMGVVNLPSGKPTMALTNGAAARLAEITPPRHDFPSGGIFAPVAARDGASCAAAIPVAVTPTAAS